MLPYQGQDCKNSCNSFTGTQKDFWLRPHIWMELDTRVQLKSIRAKAFRLVTKDSMMHYSTWGRWYSTRIQGPQYFSGHTRTSIWTLPYTAMQSQFFPPRLSLWIPVHSPFPSRKSTLIGFDAKCLLPDIFFKGIKINTWRFFHTQKMPRCV